jgi:CheY-like chemotaxis protein
MQKTVLIVEDVADLRLMMKMLVERYGYQAITADDGYEAIEKVKESCPDLILMDLMMPVLDGAVAVEIIRNLDGARKVPIIALTGFNEIYAQRAVEAGCNEVIKKPLDFRNLKPLLSQYLH